MTLPRAKMIQGMPGRPVLCAVYEKGVRTEEVLPAARTLDMMVGVRARVVRGSLDDPNGEKVAILEVALGARANTAEVLSQMKRLTKPQLPIAIRFVRLQLLICACRYISSCLEKIEFYPGFGPDDVQAFWAYYASGMQQLPVAQLFSAQPQPPYRALTDGFEGVLARLGARATMVEIASRPDDRPCAHL